MSKKWIKTSAWINSPQADLVAEYYVAGHTVRETAEEYGVSKGQVNNLAKDRRLTNGRSFRTMSPYMEKRKRESMEIAKKRLIQRLDTLGFEYIEGYSGKESKSVTVKCRKCGLIFERTSGFLKRGNVQCQNCNREETVKRQEENKIRHRLEAKQLAEQRAREKEAERMKNNPLGLSHYQLEREKKLDEVFICKECGAEYTPRQYVASCGGKTFSNPGYCSVECKKKALNRMSHKARKMRIGADNHRHRARKYGCEYDPSVTLKKLIERDGLRCAICGEMCDPNDHTWSKYMGPMSPTIDHIVPLSKGGGHIWDNVQIAHAMCNSKKSDGVEEAVNIYDAS